MLSLQGVSKLLGKKELFRDVSFHLQGGERNGLIGPNGAGKTTLFHIILGLIEPDTGAVTRPKWLRLGYLPQEWVPPGDKTVLASVMDVHRDRQTVETELQSLQEALNREQDAERSRALALRQSHLLERLEHLGGYDLEARACRVLAGLGFSPTQLDRPAATLSGGWAMRLELARLLLSEPDLLLLDEPTNHLDLPSQEILQNVLADFAGTILLVSHDRYLIDALATQVWEVVPGDSKLHVFEGTYSEYRASRQMTAAEAEQKAQFSRVALPKKEKPVLSKDQQRRVRLQIEKLEDEIDLLEQHLKTLEVELENPPADSAKVQRLGEEYARVQADLDERIEEWTRLGEEGI